MIAPWRGDLKVAFIVASVQSPGYDPWPADWRERVLQRISYDPDPVTGVDRSLRTYIATISSGEAGLDAELLGMVTVPGCGAGPAIQAAPTSHLYDVACVVFPSGTHNCGGMAILRTETPFPYFDPPRDPNRLLGWCRFRIDESVGTWAMELIHAATGFDDLYKTEPHPGRYDVMACNCGTHPSSFTKAKLGWTPTSAMADVWPRPWPFVQRARATLHAVGLPQPPPSGRITGLRAYRDLFDPEQYYLVEARLKTDRYETGASGLSSGIPSEGVVVYEVDESVWAPMKLRTPTALRVGERFDGGAGGVTVTVTDTVPGGFEVTVGGPRADGDWLIPVLHQMM
jgi:hypothetical protein